MLPGQAGNRMFQVDDKPMETWNVWVGCRFNCIYCNARKLALGRLKNSPRYLTGFEPHLVKEELRRTFKPGDFVFVGYMGDISFAPHPVIIDILALIRSHPETRFLFCTKNPFVYQQWQDHWPVAWPDNLYLGTTIETTRNFMLSQAPSPKVRYLAMKALSHPKKFISIEPICDFELDEMLFWMEQIKPVIIEVGADNYWNSLPEPDWEKVVRLLDGLRQFCPNVVEKVGLDRLSEGKKELG